MSHMLSVSYLQSTNNILNILQNARKQEIGSLVIHTESTLN